MRERVWHRALCLACVWATAPLGGCKSETAPVAAPARSARAAPSAPVVPAAPAPAAGRTTPRPLPEVSPARPPLTHQLEHEVTQVSFLGWTADERYFALEVQHGVDMGGLGGVDVLRLKQVHDTLTGLMVDSYRVSRRTDDGAGGKPLWNRAWKEAKPGAAWAAFSATNPLHAPQASLRGPQGRWQLRAAAAGAAPGRTRFRIDDQLRYTWDRFRGSPALPGARAPEVQISAVQSAQSWPLLTFRVPFDYGRIVGYAEEQGDEPAARGGALAHWAPSGRRVLLLLSARVDNVNEEDPMSDQRYYLRAVGPQIRLVAPASAARAARQLAAQLDSDGLPVAHLALSRTTPPADPVVYYRGADGAALAGRVARRLGAGVKTEPLGKPGWLQLVVVLGAPR